MGDSNITENLCKCGGFRITETDPVTNATFIECAICHRMIGGLSLQDADAMWKEAMKK